MAAELRLANTCITTLDPSLTKDVLYERLVDILKKNEIDEIGILPFLPEVSEVSDCRTEKLALYPFVVQERGTKLGIPVFCWVPLLDASYAVLKEACRVSRLSASPESRSVSSEWWSDPERCSKVKESTSCLMVLCPDSFTALNARKRLVLIGQLDPEKEMRLSNMALTFPRNCKSSGAWHHRRWLLCYMFKDHETVPLDPTVVEEQLKVCHLAAERYPKCYYAWRMRLWLIEHLGRYWWARSLQSQHDDTLIDPVQLRPLMREFTRMRTYVQTSISDHSTLQHYQQCMIQLSGRWIVQQQESLKCQEQQQQHQQRFLEPKETILQWTRSELAARRKRRDDWYLTHKSRIDQDSKVVYKSAIKSVVVPTINIKGEEEEKDGRQDIEIDADENNWISFPWVVKLWISELKRVRDLIKTYPGHESLWYHLRFIHYGLRWLDCEMDFDDIQHIDSLRLQAEEKKEEELSHLFVSTETETVFVEQLSLNDTPETNISTSGDDDAHQKQCQYAEKYLTWVKLL